MSEDYFVAIKKDEQEFYVTKVEVTANNVVVYTLTDYPHKAQKFSRLEAALFLRITKDSKLLGKKRKGYYVISIEDMIGKLYTFAKAQGLTGQWLNE